MKKITLILLAGLGVFLLVKFYFFYKDYKQVESDLVTYEQIKVNSDVRIAALQKQAETARYVIDKLKEENTKIEKERNGVRAQVIELNKKIKSIDEISIKEKDEIIIEYRNLFQAHVKQGDYVCLLEKQVETQDGIIQAQWTEIEKYTEIVDMQKNQIKAANNLIKSLTLRLAVRDRESKVKTLALTAIGGYIIFKSLQSAVTKEK